ncbi:MAG: DEAD/DEAH box helicase [Bacilli bacterium]|jgi:ATP-dependent RNA helicase CshB|nr:DEAD/DEAH box helicase [Bacilli bacterium]
MSKFKDFHFREFIYKALEEINFTDPTLVQTKVLPKAIKGQSLMVESATGSGKTHSFMIPIFQTIDVNDRSCQAVIISPTRELAEQLYNVAVQIAKHSKPEISIAKVIGGIDRDTELKRYERLEPQIVIGTVGRIHDLVITSNVLKIHNAKTIVIDEADMIFEEKEIQEVDHIMGKIQNMPQFLIFSATISKGLRAFLNKYLQNIETIILEEKNLTKDNIEHLMLQCKAKQKEHVLLDLLQVINPYLAIIFVNKKDKVESLSMMLAENGFKVGKIHGAMDDRDRKQMLRRIKNLEFKYVVASDIAARGIDIEGVSHVINFDLPVDIEFYIHRTGRTARFNNTGTAISLYAYDDDAYVNGLREKGLVVKFVKLVDGELVPTKLVKRSGHSFVRDIETKVHQQVRMPKKVKPGYKKKRKAEIDKKIRKAKREYISEIYKRKAKEKK